MIDRDCRGRVYIFIFRKTGCPPVALCTSFSVGKKDCFLAANKNSVRVPNITDIKDGKLSKRVFFPSNATDRPLTKLGSHWTLIGGKLWHGGQLTIHTAISINYTAHGV